MGYYDQDYVNRYEKNNRGKFSRYFLASLLGAVIGALIVIFSLPTLAKNNLLPYSVQQQYLAQNNRGEKGNSSEIIQNVSVNVETDITKAVDKASDAVVGITNIQSGNFWTQTQEAGTGSGVIYKKVGDTAFVVTNHHVVENADKLEVTLADGTKLEAKFLGSDIWTDLAVLAVDGDKITTVAEFGNSDTLKPGEPVIAIGNPLGLEFAGSITQGIISGLERTVPLDFNNDGLVDWNAEVIQTDAAINPGNSGGALVNIAGQVIGINSMKIAQQEVEGIGFSIPINSAIPVIESLEQYGEMKRPYLGVQLQDVSQIPAYHQQQTLKLPRDITTGLMISDVVRNSPAQKAGLQRLDVIVKLDEYDIHNIIDLRKHLYNRKQIGDRVVVGFYRDGQYQETTVTLGQESM
ncbi:S1C family serine protease [Bacillus kwashiorkori]|uniref:S1C family serine protease n=1 Tax=Bacillus kwashiorkori TaxID=1522318 RepID=UPI0007825B26|nr:trypsin-like peptidase domain-containing protein [Bacillus kwashiorkori]